MSTTKATIDRQSACGCTASTATCQCGLPDCGTCNGQGFLRPRFFSGQLLTEDDLELLSGYVTGKNRLHNRMLFGDGVVCGLNVVCHPCDCDKVIVKPGYALDCCGNDVVVPCEQTLDILAMLRSLREKMLGGYDCSDPCAGATTATRTTGRIEASRSTKESGLAKLSPQRYCLYVRYCETQQDLVTPYASSDACGAADCEASRVREGFAFEVRCREDDPARVDLLSTVYACFRDIVSLEPVSFDAVRLQKESRALSAAHEAVEATPSLDFTDVHRQRLIDARSQLQIWVSGERPVSDEARAVSGAELTGRYAGTIARFQLLPFEQQKKTLERFPELSQELEIAPELLASVSVQLENELRNKESPLPPLDVEYVQAAVQMAVNSDVQNVAFSRLWAEGVVYTPSLQATYLDALRHLQRSLLERLHPGRTVTDCRLREDIARVRLPGLSTASGELGASVQFVQSADVLVGAWLRMLADCICQALIPPCPPCDDPAVLLACFDVEECEVTTICNTSRKFVLTGHAMRYWVPALGTLGELLEFACCAVRGRLAEVNGLRALAARLGAVSADGKARIDLGPNQVLSFLQTYYGTAIGTSQELTRLPKVIESVLRTVTHRLDIGMQGQPRVPQPPVTDQQIVDQVKFEVGRKLATELPKSINAYLPSRVEDLVVAKLPDVLATGLSSEVVEVPVRNYLAVNLRASVSEVAKPLLEQAIEPAFLTLAGSRIQPIAERAVSLAVTHGIDQQIETRLQRAVDDTLAEVIPAVANRIVREVATPIVQQSVGAVLESELNGRLDEMLPAQLSVLIPEATRVALSGAARPLVAEIVSEQIEAQLGSVRTEIQRVSDAGEELKRSVASRGGATTKKLNGIEEQVAKQTAELQERLAQIEAESGQMKAQLLELTSAVNPGASRG